MSIGHGCPRLTRSVIHSILFKLSCGNQLAYNELWPLTFDLRTPNSNLTCILVSSNYTSKIFKILPTFLKLLCGNQFEYIMSCDLWPADSEFELDLYFSVIYLHIKNIQNPSNIFEVIVWKPIWIYNELWPLTCGLRIRTWPVFWCHLPTYRKYPKSVQDFWSYCAETFDNSGDGRTNSGDGRTDGATHNAPSRLRLRGHKNYFFLLQNIEKHAKTGISALRYL